VVLANRGFLQPFEPSRPERYFTAEGQADEAARQAAQREADTAFPFCIVEATTGAVVGRITLSSVVRGAWQNANLGYWVAGDRCGRGYATEAVGLAVRFAFLEAGLHRVQAAVMPRNEPSIRVLRRNGFRREGEAMRYLRINGVWEDHVVFAITREEWEPDQTEPHRA
jgi:ribosomal-protein-alanine N-acetyltransferase